MPEKADAEPDNNINNDSDQPLFGIRSHAGMFICFLKIYFLR